MADSLRVLFESAGQYFWLIAAAFVLSEIRKCYVTFRMDWRTSDPDLMQAQVSVVRRVPTGQKRWAKSATITPKRTQQQP